MRTELSLVVMAGVVLFLFLIVGELAALRKRARRTITRLNALYASGRLLRLGLEVGALSVFFLIQPVLIALLVALVMDGINPEFSSHVLRQIRAAL